MDNVSDFYAAILTNLSKYLYRIIVSGNQLLKTVKTKRTLADLKLIMSYFALYGQ